AFYLIAVRGMEKGGGPPASTLEVLASLVGQGLGGLPGWWSLPWLLFAGCVFVIGIWLLRREGQAREPGADPGPTGRQAASLAGPTVREGVTARESATAAG